MHKKKKDISKIKIYESAVKASPGNSVGVHTKQTKSLGFKVMGPSNLKKQLEAKANELYKKYKPYVKEIIVTFDEDSRFDKILVRVGFSGKPRDAWYEVDQMIKRYKEVLASYKIPLKNNKNE